MENKALFEAQKACMEQNLEQFVSIIMSGEVGVSDVEEASGFDLLMVASYAGCDTIVKFLLKEGADVDYINPKDGNTALIVSVARKKNGCMDLLLKAGADVEIANKKEITPLMAACDAGNEYGVEKILNKNPNVLRRDSKKLTCLDFALNRNNYKIISRVECLIMEYRIPINNRVLKANKI